MNRAMNLLTTKKKIALTGYPLQVRYRHQSPTDCMFAYLVLFCRA